eukprot:9503793-Lingulodinium_polyedra.AAC.1
MGVPCETWSRARRPGSGPPPLRSDRFVYGYPDLVGTNAAKVKLHNRIMQRSFQLARLCNNFGVQWAIENP